MTKRLICLDTETTGFSHEYDRIIEIGCVDITNGWEKRESFQRYINPERSVPSAAMEVHGLSQEFLKQFDPFPAHIDDFLEFIEGAILIIHNANFDISFLNAELKRYSKDPLKNEVIDTLKLAKEQFPGKKVNLNALKDYFNINIQREYHGALLDSEILAQIYIAMHTTQTGLELKTTQITVSTEPSKKLLILSQEEITENNAIINSIKKAI